MILGFDDYAPDEQWQTDAVIVGSGAGGAAVAAALVERGLSVVILEQGSHWRPQEFKQDSVWAYRNLYADFGARATVGNTVIPVPGGRGVGGSTLINSAICFRTPDEVMRHWSSDLGCVHMDSTSFSEKLDRVWRTIGVTVNPISVQRKNNLMFRRGSENLGLNGDWMPRSAPGCGGCGVCQLGCPTGAKWSVDRTFLAEALRTERCVVRSNCRVEEVTTQGGRAISLQGDTINPMTWKPEGRFSIKAETIVISAGPVGSPRFLLANGLASPDVTGRHLYLHPAAGMIARFDEEIRAWDGVTQGYYVDRWDHGYLLQTYVTTPDQTYASLPSILGTKAAQVVKDLAFMGMAGPLLHDEDSVGRVTPHTMTYMLGDNDRVTMLKALRECAQVFFAAGAKEVIPPIAGVGVIDSPHRVDELISLGIPARRIYLYASHPMGTCRMGTDPDTSVVSPEGLVWGWDNLYVADASVFPTSLGVNPQVTTMGIGLMVGEIAGPR